MDTGKQLSTTSQTMAKSSSISTLSVKKKIQVPCKHCTNIFSNPNIDVTKADKVISFAKTQFNMLKTEFTNNEIDEEVEETLKLIEKENAKKVLEKEKNKRLSQLIAEKQVTTVLRTSILDWMMIVFKAFNLSEKTKMLSLEIYDRILEIYNFDLSVPDFHLLSITSIFVATKFEEIRPISLEDAVKFMAKGKFNKKDIVNTELIILSRLNFQMPKILFIDFATIVLNILFSSRQNAHPNAVMPTRSIIVFNSSENGFSIIPDQVVPVNPANSANGKSSVAGADKDNSLIPRASKGKSKTEIGGARLIEKSKTLLENATDDNGNCIYRNTVFGFSKVVFRLVFMDYEVCRVSNVYLLYLSVIFFSFSYLNSVFRYYKHFDEELFIAICEKFSVSKIEIEETQRRIFSLYNNRDLEIPYLRGELEIFQDLNVN